MNKDWFEQALRDKYPAEAHDFDTDTAWAALEARRRRKRRPFGLWWLTATGIAVLGAAVMFWPEATPQPNGRKGTVPVAAVAPVVGKPTADPSATAPLVPATPKKIAREDKAGPAEPEPLAAQQAIVKTKRPTTKTGTSAVETPLLAENTRPVLAPALEPAVGNVSEKSPPQAAIPSAIPPEIHHSSPPLAGQAFIIHHSFPPLAGPPFTIHHSSFIIHQPEPLATYWLGEKKKSNSKMARWWLGVSAHYGLASVSRGGDNEDYIQKRNSEETALDMFQAGLDVRYHLKPNLFLQTGLYFAQWTDVRERTFQENYTVLDSNYLIGTLIKADGSVQNIYGPVDIVHIRTTTAETYNRYRHVELPLLAGVSLPVGGQWRFECAAGPVFGLLSTRSGSIRDPQNGNANLPLQDGPYRNSGTISGMMRLEWVYAADGWSAGIGVMGRFGLTDWAAPDQPFTEKRHALGTGLVFRKALR